VLTIFDLDEKRTMLLRVARTFAKEIKIPLINYQRLPTELALTKLIRGILISFAKVRATLSNVILFSARSKIVDTPSPPWRVLIFLL
jgi:hypothetical protein